MKFAAILALLVSAQATFLESKTVQSDKACLSEDLQHRVQLQNKLAGYCEDMCKEVGAYPKCTCPNFVKPDETPGVMTWPELLTHMDNLSDWSNDLLKEWRSTRDKGMKK